MTNIFYIANEHQIMQVENVIDNYVIDAKSILLCNKKIKETMPIQAFLAKEKVKVIFYESWLLTEVYTYRRKLNNFFYLIKSIKMQDSEFNIYSSEYHNDCILILNDIISPKTFYLMDEGVASINIADLRNKTVKINKLFKLIIKSVLYRRKLFYPKALVFISEYDLKIHKRDSIIKIKNSIQKNKVDKITDEVHIIGSSMVEAGILKEDIFINYIKVIQIENRGKQIFYFSHKKEKKTKLETIKEIGVIIVGYDIPYEFRFSKNAEIPFRIYSFISPVVYNIANKFKNIPELYSVNFPIKDILKRKSVYQQILITYSKHPLIKTLNIY